VLLGFATLPAYFCNSYQMWHLHPFSRLQMPHLVTVTQNVRHARSAGPSRRAAAKQRAPGEDRRGNKHRPARNKHRPARNKHRPR
jgi:hypothetical protein